MSIQRVNHPTPGINDIEFGPQATQKSCIDKIFVEVKFRKAPEWTQSLVNNMEAHHKQYGLKHYVTGTIHRAMVDALINMATEM